MEAAPEGERTDPAAHGEAEHGGRRAPRSRPNRRNAARDRSSDRRLTLVTVDKMRSWTKEQILVLMRESQEAGHVLAFSHKAPPAEHPEGNHKFYAECSCGYHSATRATHKAIVEAGLYHLMKESLARDISEVRRRNGVSVPKTVGGSA